MGVEKRREGEQAGMRFRRNSPPLETRDPNQAERKSLEKDLTSFYDANDEPEM